MPRAGALAAHTLRVLLPAAKWCSGAGAVLGAQAARPGVLAAGQMCGHCVGTEPRDGPGEPWCWAVPAKATASSPAREG